MSIRTPQVPDKYPHKYPCQKYLLTAKGMTVLKGV